MGVRQYVRPSVRPSVCLSVCLSVCVSIRPPVCLSVCNCLSFRIAIIIMLIIIYDGLVFVCVSVCLFGYDSNNNVVDDDDDDYDEGDNDDANNGDKKKPKLFTVSIFQTGSKRCRIDSFDAQHPRWQTDGAAAPAELIEMPHSIAIRSHTIDIL